MTTHAQAGLARTILLMFSAFSLAFCLQLVVHEGGHFITGSLAGQPDGRVILHPFQTSKVVFSGYPGTATLVVVGLAGPVLDLLVAIGLALAFRRSRSLWAFPALTWAAIALFGEGLGMVGSLSWYTSSGSLHMMEDTTQLLRLGIPIGVLWAAAIILTVAGLILMALIAPAAGVRQGGGWRGWLARLAAYAAYLPAWFVLAIVWIRAASPSLDNLEVRNQQVLMAGAAAILLASLDALIRSTVGRFVPPKPLAAPGWKDVWPVAAAALAATAALLVLPPIFL